MQVSANSQDFRFPQFTFKICQTIEGRFLDFLKSRFWRVFAVWPNCAPPAAGHITEEVATPALDQPCRNWRSTKLRFRFLQLDLKEIFLCSFLLCFLFYIYI